MAKENKYDEPVFFEKYSQMYRSKLGLSGAGEWETLKKFLPELRGKRMLDLGCGYGWHCIYAAEHGAAQVVGVDISEKMLAVAKEKTKFPQVLYKRSAMEELCFPENSFNLVFSSLAFHYVEDFGTLLEQVWRWLEPGGDFIFSVEHPVFTAEGSQDWLRDEEGKICCFPVDNYFFPGKREACFLGEKLEKYHRTLADYLEGLLRQGFSLVHVAEPQPPEQMLELPGMKDELRRPMMLLIAARK